MKRELEAAMTIHAIFENGVFRPVGSVNLPDSCEVDLEVRTVKPGQEPTLDDVYAILSRRYNSGQNDVAERHNEHQP